MKIIKSQLSKIINEEYSRAVSRREKPIHFLGSVDADDLLKFAEKWAKTGLYVQENVQQLMTGEFEDLDPAAIQEARSLLEGFHPVLDEAFSEYEKHINVDDQETTLIVTRG